LGIFCLSVSLPPWDLISLSNRAAPDGRFHTEGMPCMPEGGHNVVGATVTAQ
jgi:hypothetical protein